MAINDCLLVSSRLVITAAYDCPLTIPGEGGGVELLLGRVMIYRHWGFDPKLDQSRSQAPKLEVFIDELQLESTSLKVQTMITVDAGTDCSYGKVI
jgi:hypothetical protein